MPKILIELNIEISTEKDDKHHTAVLSHPDLVGHLYLRGTSTKMLEVQLESLTYNQILETNPVSQILESANKFATGVGELKDVLKKGKASIPSDQVIKV